MTVQPRRREVTWEDPAVLARAAVSMPGREFLTAIASGELPPAPVASLVGFRVVDVGDGSAVFELDPGEHQYNPLGSVHGGVLATVLDSALGCAVQSQLPDGSGYTTLELKVNFVRPVTATTGPLRCEGTVIHSGRRTATAEARIADADGRLYAHATTTCLVFTTEGT